ncbi:hypothetical protein PSENEW3_00003523 [Picochlorum sp. SENEW3]|nr:hypothetical protein PSENEW3_00003523 [Picochlorum sp. SENEW3]
MDSEEEELLMLQAQMMRSGSQPAATTTRVAVNKGKDAPCSDMGDSGVCSTIPNDILLPIVGDVVERKTTKRTGKSTLLPATGGARPAFPEAVHRSKSKFSFSRRMEKKEDNASVGVDGGGESNEENGSDILAGMSTDDIESAKAEVLSRFSARTIEFLKKRGQKNKVFEKKEAMKLDAVNQHAVTQSPQPTSALERVRFGMDGSIVAFVPESEPIDLTSVVKRDLVRQSEGSVDSTRGYTVLESCMLARSSDGSQRSIGLRFMTEFLIQCRNNMWLEAYDGVKHMQSRSVSLSTAIKECEGGHVLSDIDLEKLTWVALWNHAIYKAEVVKIIRYSLDDGSAKVRREASRALSALVGLPHFALEMVRAADANPSIGWPRCQIYYMQRSDTGNWVSLPLDIMEQEKGDADERDVARIDPISGLLNMRTLNRITYLLKSDVGDSESMDLLSVLYHFCLGGAHATDLMAETPDLVDTLLCFVPLLAESATMDPKVLLTLNVLREIVDASSHKLGSSALNRLANFASKSVLSSNLDKGNATVEQIEGSIRLWRCLKMSERIFTLFDDMYGALCMSMYPSWDEGSTNHQKLPIAREAFLAAAECSLRGQISSSCCVSMIKDIHIWVSEAQAVGTGSLFVMTPGMPTHVREDLLNMIGAILHFVQCCCSSDIVWEAEEDKRYALGFVPDCINGIYALLFGTGEQNSLGTHLLDGSIFEVTSKMAIINSILQIIYIQSVDVDWKDSLIESSVSVMRHLQCLSSPLSESKDSFDIFQPWEFTKYQHICQFARLFDAVQLGSGEIDRDLQTDMNLRLLSRLAPGSEDVGLRLISHLFSAHVGNYFIQKGLDMVQNHARFTQGSATIEKGKMNTWRLEAFANLSRVTGYEVQDVSDWTALTKVRNYSYQSVTMRGQGSFFPLQTTWMLSTAHCKTHQSISHDAFCGILSWTLGIESDNKILDYVFPRIKHRALMSMIFESDAHRTILLHDQGVQSLASCLLAKYIDDITSIITDTREENCEWNESNIRNYIEIFASESYGDGFFGAALATLFCHNVTVSSLQEELLSLLKDTMAMHHVPTMDHCVGNARVYLPLMSENTNPLGFLFLLDILSSQSFAKSITTASIVVDIVMHHLMSHIEGSKDANKAVQVLGRIARMASSSNREHLLHYFTRWDPYTAELQETDIEWRYKVFEESYNNT